MMQERLQNFFEGMTKELSIENLNKKSPERECLVYARGVCLV